MKDPAATETSRQRIVEILRREEMGFEELRRELDVPGRQLEEDLRHVEKSLRRGSERLRIDPARIFAGRGLPKVIFSTGDCTSGPVAKPAPATATCPTTRPPRWRASPTTSVRSASSRPAPTIDWYSGPKCRVAATSPTKRSPAW